MTLTALKQRVEARDRLLQQAEQVGQQLNAQLLLALARGELSAAEAAARSHDAQLHELTENLRIYQAELHAQADELATSQARTEDLLSRFTTLFSNMPVAALLVAANGEVLEHNTVAARLMGLRPRHMAARFVHRLVDNDTFQRLVRPAFLEAQTNGQSMADNVHFIGEGGQHFIGELHIAKLRSEQAADGAFICAVVDRTEHLEDVRALERALEAQRQVRVQMSDLAERLAIANDAGGIGVWDCDLRSDTLVFDHRMGQLFGLPGALPQQGSLAAALRPCLTPEHALLLQQALDAAVHRQEPLNLELHLGTDSASGPTSPSWVHITGRAHADVEGRTVRLVGCAWDSSPQHEALRLKAAHDAAENASRAKSAFLSRMSHELRTPLNAILGFSQLMRMEAEAGDLVLKPHRVTLIESAARHLLDLVNEVLDVSRIEAGQMDVRLVRCDLRKIVVESLPMVQGQADALGVTLHDGLQPGPSVWVLGDRLRLKELAINLLSNAVKYNRAGGRVDVSSRAVPGGIELHIADTGRGLDEQQLQNLFQPFNRLGAEALGIQGSGMGLFVCRRFVELMGGDLRVHSQAGVGTTVVARLDLPPQEDAELVSATELQGHQATRHTFNMLVPPG